MAETRPHTARRTVIAAALALGIASSAAAPAMAQSVNHTPSITSAVASTSTAHFKDVRPTSRHFQAVQWMADQGITTGYVDGTFRSTAPATRGEAVTFLYRMFDKGQAVPAANFKDVRAGSFLASGAAWAKATGVSTGHVDGTFRPNVAVSRADFVVMLYRAAGSPAVNVDGAAFKDTRATGYQAPALAWAKSQGIIRGHVDGTYRPHDALTRGDAAVILQRFEHKLG